MTNYDVLIEEIRNKWPGMTFYMENHHDRNQSSEPTIMVLFEAHWVRLHGKTLTEIERELTHLRIL